MDKTVARVEKVEEGDVFIEKINNEIAKCNLFKFFNFFRFKWGYFMSGLTLNSQN